MSFLKKYEKCLAELNEDTLNRDLQELEAVERLLRRSDKRVCDAIKMAKRNGDANQDTIEAMDYLSGTIKDTVKLNEQGIRELYILSLLVVERNNAVAE